MEPQCQQCHKNLPEVPFMELINAEEFNRSAGRNVFILLCTVCFRSRWDDYFGEGNNTITETLE